MAIRDRKKSSLPIFLALGSLILLILLLGYYFGNCFKGVLGVSTFNSSSSKNPVTDGQTFNFVATVVGDQSGALNATVLFNLTGSGVINSNIQGPGACVKLTDTTAACNNVNIDPNQTIIWTVPVTANTNCSQNSPATLTLQTRLVATAVVSSSIASVNCVALTTNPTPTPPSTGNGTPIPSATTTGGGGNPSGTNNIYNTTGGGNQGVPMSTSVPAFNFAGLACSKVSGLPLVFILFILWLLVCAYYFIFSNRR